jgi:hypothetical protein
MKGRITISRMTGGPAGPEIRIEFIDEISRVHFAQMVMTPEAFARCVTGQGEVEAELEVRQLDRVGMKPKAKLSCFQNSKALTVTIN